MRSLTRKEKAFVQELVSNPKQSPTQAALKVYGQPNKPTTYGTAEQIAHTNLSKPKIITELAKYSSEAENTLIKVMKQSEDKMYEDSTRAVDWASNARQTADSILDRVHGKATQRTEVHAQVVTLDLDVSDLKS